MKYLKMLGQKLWRTSKNIIVGGTTALAGVSGCADHGGEPIASEEGKLVDSDGDGVYDNGTTNIDNCKWVVNPLQEDKDDDGIGDACDVDTDGDSICDGAAAVSGVCSAGPDNCRMVKNIDQMNTDMDLEDKDMTGTVGDPEGDACDTDDDNDGLCDPLESGDDCDGMDLCQYTPSENNNDDDGDGFGDPCDNDTDGDGVRNDGEGEDPDDNCPDDRNQAQDDFDDDGEGDVCDTDDDGDGVPDAIDNCVHHCNPNQLNTDANDGNAATEGDLFGDACDQDPEGDGTIDFQWWAPEMLEWSCGDNNETCTTQNAAVVCDDDSNCTTEWCNDGQCAHTPVVCDDGNGCTTNSCDPTTGCTYVALNCVDANMCNGLETCNPASGCVAGTSTPTDDLNQCTNDACDPTTGAVTHTPLPTINDLNACTTDLCDTSTGTITHPAVNCDDSNSTTADSCNSADNDGDPCVHTPTGACVTAADCNDSDPSTYDTCVSLVCQHAPGIRVQVSSTDTSETWQVNFYYNGTTISGTLPFDGTLPRTLSCDWGVDIAVNRPSTNLFWDCNPGFPSKSTLTVLVDSVPKVNDFETRASACGGVAPGNLWLSDESGDNDLSCPAPP